MIWGFEDRNDPTCVKSRTGFVIEVMGCPIFWQSRLQGCIATSTMEAEYTALSMALRAAIPFMEVCQYVISRLWETSPGVGIRGVDCLPVMYPGGGDRI